MSKLIQKLKTIIPSTQLKVLFTCLLLFSSICLAFTFINSFNLNSVWLTILVTFGIGILLFIITNGLIFALPKFIKSNINTEQYHLIFTLLFSSGLSGFLIIFMNLSSEQAILQNNFEYLYLFPLNVAAAFFVFSTRKSGVTCNTVWYLNADSVNIYSSTPNFWAASFSFFFSVDTFKISA